MDESIVNLYGMLKLYNDTSWKYNISGLLSRKLSLNNKKYTNDLSRLNDVYLTPNFAKIIKSNEHMQSFLLALSPYCSITTDLHKFIYGVSDKLENYSALEPLRRNIYVASREIKQGNYEDANSILVSALKTLNEDNLYHLEIIYRKLYNSYANLSLINSIINITVNAYFKNHNLIKRFDIKEYFDIVKHSRSPEVKKSISYPIFIYLCDKTDHKSQRIAYSNYLDSNNFI